MNESIEFFNNTCPLTGLPTRGRATVKAVGANNDVLYTFAPIGRAIFLLQTAVSLTQLIMQGDFKTRPDLAGLCRETIERGAEPLVLSHKEFFGEPQSDTPTNFEEKQLHLLRFLYEMGGREHKKRNIQTYNDFPLAYAKDAEELIEIVDSIIDEGWLTCDNLHEHPNSWPSGIRPAYYGVLPTKEGKEKVRQILAPMVAQVPKAIAHPPAISTLHLAVQQAIGSRFVDGYYSDALHKACTALEKAVQDKASQPLEPTGATLMSKVFSKDKPILTVSANQGEQEGYMFLYRGLAQAIRNHYAHNDPAIDPARALEWLGFISALFYKLDEAQSMVIPLIP
jgi:uncharacterized protein (TIGR02391 family)